MEKNTNPPIDKTELETSLARLGIKELEERMEISPLLADTGAAGTEPNAIDNCCSCKIPTPGEDLPYPTIDPGPTGPTNPNGIY